jgi:hypothetical protein
MRSLKAGLIAAVFAVAGATSASAGPQFAVWLDGNTAAGGGGQGILTSLDNAFGAGSYQLISTAQLDTPGFLSSFKTVIVSRFGSSFGSSLSAASAANVHSYVGGPGAGQGGVAVFTNDASDNLFGSVSGDPYDANLNALFINAVKFAAASGHGYIGEFNGAIAALATNTAGFNSADLLVGNATGLHFYGPQFTYDIGTPGVGAAIYSGVTLPFTDSDSSTYLTDITGFDTAQLVLQYTSSNINGEPAILANSVIINGVPEPTALALFGFGVMGFALARRRR